MTQQPTPGTLLGEHGETLSRPSDSLADLNLPPGVQALIETRINTALDQLREDNRKEIENLTKKHTRRWQIIGAILLALNLASWFIAPQQIKKWAKDYVQKRMTAPELKKAADEAIKTQMGTYVAGQIEPLKKDVAEKQKQLAEKQESLREQVEIQEHATAAKAGDSSAYDLIVSKAGNKGPVQQAATAALHEVEIYYDLDAAQIFYPRWAESTSRQDPGWSIEELLLALRQQKNDAPSRSAIINTLGNVAKATDEQHKGVVAELYRRLSEEKDLRVRARTVRALNMITNQDCRPLDFAACEAWHKLHGSEPQFQSPYAGFFRALEQLSAHDKQDHVIVSLNETIRQDPNAIYARSIKAGLSLDAGDLATAENELAEIEKKRGDFRWMSFLRAKLRLAQGKTKEAVESLNAAMAKSPSLEDQAKSDSQLATLLADPNIQLPSKKKSN